MHKLKTLGLLTLICGITYLGCKKDEDKSEPTKTNTTAGTCSDGIQNQDETGIDCGGATCPPCETCSDGIQNQDETGIDCGGSVCPPCPEPTPSATYFIKAKINGSWFMEQTNNPYRAAIGGGIASLNGDTRAGLEFNIGTAFIQESDVQALVGVPVTFSNSSGIPYVVFRKGTKFSSEHDIDQTGHTATINSYKKEDPSPGIFGDEYFDIVGTFTCNISDGQGTIQNVTEGTFKLRTDIN